MGLSRATLLAPAFVLLGLSATHANDFTFEGRTIEIVAATAPGTGIDISARTFAEHLPGFLPGNPNVIVQNAPGAGGNQGRNQVYQRAPKDGTQLVFAATALQDELLESPGVLYSHADLTLIGAVVVLPTVSYVRREVLGSDNPADIVNVEGLRLGGTRPDSSLDMFPRAALETLGVSYDYITGYQGNVAVSNALRAGEVDIATASGAQFASVILPTLQDEIVPLWYYPSLDANGNPEHNKILEEAGVRSFVDVYAEAVGGELEGIEWEALKFVLEVRSFANSVLWGPPEMDEDAATALRNGVTTMFEDAAFVETIERAYGTGTVLTPIEDAVWAYRNLERFNPEAIEYWKEMTK